jgi:hypothetical protein
MSEPRLEPGAGLLPDGRVVVAGGHGFPTFPESSRTAEIYDPAANTWTPTGSLAIPRGEGNTMDMLPDGRAIIVGGYWWRQITPGPPEDWSDPVYEDTAEIYDPRSGAWTTTPPMVAGRAGHVSAVLPGGDLLVAGGYGGASPFGQRFSVSDAPAPAPQTLPGPTVTQSPARPVAGPARVSAVVRVKAAVPGFASGAAARRLTVSRAGIVAVRVTCAAGAGTCRDEVVLKTRGKHPRTLGRARFTLKAGEAGTVTVKLSRTVRTALRGRSTAARVVLVKRARGLDVTVRG